MLQGLIDPMLDQDGDGLLPLMEYALGGDPTNGADVAILPAVEVAQNGSITYTYRRQQDAAARGLTYTVKRATNLVDWSTNGCVEVGSDPIDVEFESVTVWVDSGDTVFVRLEISLDE
tara:strand:+ start:987 stop:1340 length:354 start_codon:yes stop_codon:yes gene_type:complete